MNTSTLKARIARLEANRPPVAGEHHSADALRAEIVARIAEYERNPQATPPTTPLTVEAIERAAAAGDPLRRSLAAMMRRELQAKTAQP